MTPPACSPESTKPVDSYTLLPQRSRNSPPDGSLDYTGGSNAQLDGTYNGGCDMSGRGCRPGSFRSSLPPNRKILQALNRLTFGPRPGDAQAVKAMGLKKWIDRQLHPEQIAENPVLTEKLKTLDTLPMSRQRNWCAITRLRRWSGRWSTGGFPSLPIPTAS